MASQNRKGSKRVVTRVHQGNWANFVSFSHLPCIILTNAVEDSAETKVGYSRSFLEPRDLTFALGSMTTIPYLNYEETCRIENACVVLRQNSESSSSPNQKAFMPALPPDIYSGGMNEPLLNLASGSYCFLSC